MKYKIYTDGACSGNPGPGGYGIVMQKFGTDYLKEFSEGFKKTTNNRMELEAVIQGLKTIEEKSQITVYTDSQYVQKGITEWIFNWKKNS